MAEHKQTNFRLPPETHKNFTKALQNRKRVQTDVWTNLAEQWIIDESIETVSLPLFPSKPPRSLNKIITAHLIELLQKEDWLPPGVVLDVQLFREGHSIFGTRIDHFRAEKMRLALGLADWLVQRALSYIRKSSEHHAFLCMDSGTGIYWVFRFLPDAIKTFADKDELHRLHIVTNNVAGSECYGTRTQQIKKQDPNTFGGRELSELVKCTLLGGELLPKYSALTGDLTEANLKAIRSKGGDKTRFFGVAAGHWVELPQGSETPVPLARGSGQVSFKETLIEQCHEVFVLAPLGKLFAGTEDVTNKALAAISRAKEGLNQGLQGGASGSKGATKPPSVGNDAYYSRVPIGNRNKVKLVTSLRSRGLLYTLSEKIHERYRIYGPADNPAPDAPIETIRAVLFDFDHPKTITSKEEFQLDFPHEYEWNTEFLTSVFGVQLKDESVLQEIREEYEAQTEAD